MTEPTFIEDWFGLASQKTLTRLAFLTHGLPGAVIEVGSWEGCSTIALANAVHPTVVSAVDTWEGSPGEISAKLASERDVYGTFMTNIHAGTKGNVCPYKQGWRDYFAAHKGQLIRLLFIDAEHSYREVFDTIEAALPLLVEGGIICGDDVHHPPIQDAVLEHFGPSVMCEQTLWWWQKPKAKDAA